MQIFFQAKWDGREYRKKQAMCIKSAESIQYEINLVAQRSILLEKRARLCRFEFTSVYSKCVQMTAKDSAKRRKAALRAVLLGKVYSRLDFLLRVVFTCLERDNTRRLINALHASLAHVAHGALINFIHPGHENVALGFLLC